MPVISGPHSHQDTTERHALSNKADDWVAKQVR